MPFERPEFPGSTPKKPEKKQEMPEKILATPREAQEERERREKDPNWWREQV